MARLGESGPGGAKATERPICKDSCKEKRLGLREVARLEKSGPAGTKATERPMCKESCKEKN